MENNNEGSNDIIDMLNNMIQEGKERLNKLQNAYRAALAPKSRAISLPTRSGSGGGECVLTGVIGPRVEDKGKDALEAEAEATDETEPTRARRMRGKTLQQDDPPEAMMSETAFNGISAP